MDRRTALAVLLATLVASATPSVHADSVPKIGYLALESIREQPSRQRQAFLEGLAEFGLVAGKSIEIVYRSAENEPEFLPAMCEELLDEKISVLATVGEQPTLACLKTTRTVPIVFLAAGDPIGFKAAESLARPTRNATGVSYILSGLAGKRIEFLRLAVPAAKRVAFLWDRRNRESQIEVQVARAAAEKLGIRAIPMPIDTQADLNARFEQIAGERPDAIYVSFAAGVIARNRTAIVDVGLGHRLPVISGWRFMTEAGGLLSYSPDIPSMFRRSAYYVDRILKGAQPGELPIEQATKIELMINLRTARRLGLTMPADLLLRADRVIE
jgi:putative ABC transport system substrate-binding protein